MLPDTAPSTRGIVAIHPDREILRRQNLPYFVGISGNSAASQGLSMHIVVIPAGCSSVAHSHRNYETEIYVLEGRVETRYGAGLKDNAISEAGDFLFIPPGPPHMATNLSPDQVARAIVARNSPSEQEDVFPYNPATGDNGS